KDRAAIDEQIGSRTLDVGDQLQLRIQLPKRLQPRFGEALFYDAPLHEPAHAHCAQRGPAAVERDVLAADISAAQGIHERRADLGIKRPAPEDSPAGEKVAALEMVEARLDWHAGPHLGADPVCQHAIRGDAVELRRPNRATDGELPADAQEEVPLQHAAFDEQGVDVAGGAPVIEWRSERLPAPAARTDAQVLQPRIAVAFSA